MPYKNKEDAKQYSKEYYIDHKEHIKQYNIDNQEYIKQRKKQWNKKYYIDNREKIKQQCKEYRQENKEDRKQYYKDNEEKIKEYQKEWRLINKEHIKEYRQENKEDAKQHNKQWMIDNKDHKKEYDKRYRQENKEHYNQYEKQKYRTDLKYNLNDKISSAIRGSLKGNKAGRHWEDLVGYTLNDLIKHLKLTLPPHYTWQDYMDGKLHVDHIIAKKYFNYTKYTHIDFRNCWSLSNLQLLSARENIIKGDKLEQPFQPSLKI